MSLSRSPERLLVLTPTCIILVYFLASAGNGITCTSGSWDCELSGVEDDYDASVERFNYALSRLERIQAIAPVNDTLAVSALNVALEDLEAARIALDAGQNAIGAMLIDAAEQQLDEVDGILDKLHATAKKKRAHRIAGISGIPIGILVIIACITWYIKKRKKQRYQEILSLRIDYSTGGET